MEIGTLNKLSWNARIVAGIIYGVFYVVLMALADWFFERQFQDLFSYLLSGLFFGAFMGIAMPYIYNWAAGRHITSKNKTIVNITLDPDEHIEIEGPANLSVGNLKSLQGKLFFTNQRLIFNPHKINLHRRQKAITYADIVKVEKRTTAWLLPNRIRVVDKDQKHYNFVVNNQEEWLFEFDKRVENFKINFG